MAGYEAVPEQWFAGGVWAGMSLGEFIRLLVDGGPTDTVLVRVTDRTAELDGSGAFVLGLELELVPNGWVVGRLREREVSLLHQDLQESISAGLVK